MPEKRYQVFISSTFDDLQDERRAVQDAVISMGDFPVQMESFPAADEDQFDFIKSLIDQCDYYVLIIGGRYGSLAVDGLSYTHKEFRYALAKGVPVLVMLHGQRGSIPVNKSERTDEGKRLLEEFIDEAQTGRLRKTWVNVDGLKLAVRETLDHAKATKPRAGWVRGDSISSIDTLSELNQVRKENEVFRMKLGEIPFDIDFPKVPNLDEYFNISINPLSIRVAGVGVRSGSHANIRMQWIAMFPIFALNLKFRVNDWNEVYNYSIMKDESCASIGSALAREYIGEDADGLFIISEDDLDLLCSYYIESGLMLDGGDDPFNEMGKKFARRQKIEQHDKSILSLNSGEIRVYTENDDIPF